MTRQYTKPVVGAVALALVVSVAVAGGAVTSQHTSESETQDTSYLRVVHASPDAPAVNVTLGNETVLSNVSFGAVSDYLRVPAGTYNVTISAAGQPSAVVYEDNLTVEPRVVATLAATGEISSGADTSFAPAVFSDDAWTPGENESAISVLHLSPDVGAVDVTATSAAVNDSDLTNETAEAGVALIADNVTFRNGSDYVNVPAGNYTAAIREETPGNNGSILAIVDVSVEGGQAYSAIAAGYATPEDEPAGASFTVIPALDASLAVHLPGDVADNETATPTPTPGNGTATATPGEGTATPTGTPEE